MLDRIPLLHTQLGEHGERRLAREHLHQIIFQTEEEAAGALVALPAASPTELIVDAARLVPLGRDHVQAADVLDVLEQAEPMQQAAAGFVEPGQQLCLGHRRDLRFAQPTQVDRPFAKQRHSDLVIRHFPDIDLGQAQFLGRQLSIHGRDDLVLRHVGVDVLRADAASLPMIDQLLRRKLA